MLSELRGMCEYDLIVYRSSTTHIHASSQRPGIQPKLEALTNLYEGKKIIVGRDKLDVVKGVVQKVRGTLPAPLLSP